LYLGDYFAYREAGELADTGDWRGAVREYRALGDFRDSPLKVREITSEVFTRYLNEGSYDSLAYLMSTTSTGIADSLMRDLDLNCGELVRVAYAAPELDSLGVVCVRRGDDGLLSPRPPDDENRLYPRIVFTGDELLLANLFGRVAIGGVASAGSGSYDLRELASRLVEMREALAEYPEGMNAQRIYLIASAETQYEDVALAMETAVESGFTEPLLHLVTGADARASVGFAGYSSGRVATHPDSGRRSLADLSESTGSGIETDISISPPTESEIEAAGRAAQVEFSVEAAGTAIEYGYRNLTSIRRRANVIKMRVQTAYEELLLSAPEARGRIDLEFKITTGGAVEGIAVEASADLASLSSDICSATSAIRFPPALEQTEDLSVQVQFELIPPVTP